MSAAQSTSANDGQQTTSASTPSAIDASGDTSASRQTSTSLGVEASDPPSQGAVGLNAKIPRPRSITPVRFSASVEKPRSIQSLNEKGREEYAVRKKKLIDAAIQAIQKRNQEFHRVKQNKEGRRPNELYNMLNQVYGNMIHHYNTYKENLGQYLDILEHNERSVFKRKQQTIADNLHATVSGCRDYLLTPRHVAMAAPPPPPVVQATTTVVTSASSNPTHTTTQASITNPVIITTQAYTAGPSGIQQASRKRPAPITSSPSGSRTSTLSSTSRARIEAE